MTTPGESVGPALRQAHGIWLAEVRAALAPARRADAGIWERWGAVQYLEREFAPRFRRERAAADAALAGEAAADTTYLWALGELLELLRGTLGDLVRMAKGGAVFAGTAEKFIRAFECWCRAVESALEQKRPNATGLLAARA